MVICVFFSILGLTLGAGLIIEFVSVRDGLIIDFVSVRDGLIIAPTAGKCSCCPVSIGFISCPFCCVCFVVVTYILLLHGCYYQGLLTIIMHYAYLIVVNQFS